MLFEGGAEVRPEQTQNYESKQGDVYHVFNDPDCPELHGLVVDISNHEATGLGCLAAAVDFTFGLNTKDMENGGSYFVDSARVQASMRFFGTIINDDAQQAAMDGAEVSWPRAEHYSLDPV